MTNVTKKKFITTRKKCHRYRTITEAHNLSNYYRRNAVFDTAEMPHHMSI